MKISDFIKDRVHTYLAALICLSMSAVFLRAFKAPLTMSLILVTIGVITFLFSELWDFYRKKNFYNTLTSQLDMLDRKYLISELIERPDFYEGGLIYDTLYEANKSMCDRIYQHNKKSKELREYIEMWVHEVKLPVASLQLMMHNHHDELSIKAAEQIRRIDSYTDQVLYYARSEYAEKDYLINEVSLNRAFANTAVKYREDILQNDIELETDGLDVNVMTDSKWLEYIFSQLLANSIKYRSSERQSIINISAENREKSILLIFRDNGIGIPQKDQPHIFDKTFTGENGRVHAKSTGMGLYIVKNLCEKLGHSIEVSSEKNKYTEFRITFPKNDFYRM